MSAAWDAVYGPGYYTAHVLGKRLYAEAAITGEQGIVYHVEFYRDDDPHVIRILGVAKDSAGNIYKMVAGAT